MKNNYKVLFLDLDNTLFDFDKSEKSALLSTANHFGFENDFKRFEEIYHAVNKPLWQAVERGEINSNQVKTERFIQLVDRLDVLVDALEMSDYYILKLSEGIDLYPFASELCETLSKKYSLVAVTNGVKVVQESRMTKSGLLKYFDALIISEDVGYSKPNPIIYDMAMRKIGHVNKETILMIGDSMKGDIQGAHDAGFDTCWVNIKEIASPTEPVYRWEINKLEQLLDYL